MPSRSDIKYIYTFNNNEIRHEKRSIDYARHQL